MTTLINTQTTITVKCDGPTCATLHNPETGLPVTLRMFGELLQTDPDAMPDEFVRFIKVHFSPISQPEEFCSKECLQEYLDLLYVVPKSPREKYRAAQPAISQADGEAQ